MEKENKMYELLTQLLDSTSDLIMICDTNDIKNYTILYVNKQMAKSFRLQKNQLIGKNFWTIIPENVANERRKQALKVIQTKKPLIFEDKRLGRSFLNHFIPIIDENHEVVYGATITKEITKMKTTEKKYQQLVDNIDEGVFTLDETGRFNYMNSIIEKRTGFTKEEFYKLKFTDIILPEYKEHVTKQFNKIMNEKKVKPFEVGYYSKNGKKIIVEINARPLYEKDTIIGVQCLSLDITEKKKVEESLRKSETKYRTIFDTSIGAILLTNMDGGITDLNPAALDILGYDDPMEVIGRQTVEGYAYPKQREALMKKFMEKGYVKNHEITFLKKNGTHVPCIGCLNALKDQDGNVIGTIGNFHDITERKKIEEKLLESEKKLRDIIYHSDELFYIHDCKQNLKYISHQSEKIFGYSPDEMKHKWTNFVTNNPINEAGFALTKKAISTGEKQEPYLLEAKRKDGKNIIVRINESPIKDEKGKVIGITGMLSDVNEQILAEKKLKESELEMKRGKEYLQNVIDSASEIIFTISSNNKIKMWNSTAEYITGLKKNQVVGKTLNEHDLFEYPKILYKYISDISKGNENQLDELIVNTKNNEKKILSVSPSFIKEKKGQVREILFICKDITKDKELHGKLIKGNSYLITDQTNNKTDTFTSLIGSGYQGLYIGRAFEENIQVLFKPSTPQFINLLAEKYNQYETINHLDKLYKKIEEFLIKTKNKNHIIFLERLDYLITINSFERVIKWIYNINELIIKHKAMFFLCINPEIFDEKQLEFIQMEFEQLPSQSIAEVSLDETQYEILKYINFENNQNALINYRDIGKKFDISKVTVKKRIDLLKKYGLLYSQKHGRSKYLNITNKGKNILSHREVI